MKKTERKSQRKALILERARRALENLYHNATPNYPRLDDAECDEFNAWFESAAEFEVEYLRDGGAHGSEKSMRAYFSTLHANPKTGAYAFRKWRDARDMERADCGMLTGWRAMEIAAGNARLAALMAKHGATERHDAMWECISEYGKLYQWGRGGQTLAPDSLIAEHGGSSFSIRHSILEDMHVRDALRMIRILESFNGYVKAWCKGVPEMWRESVADRDAELAHEETERDHWAQRDVVTTCA